MANQEHLDLLKEGMKVWNAWRYEHSDIRPDFSGADLSDAFLSSYYFGGYTQSRVDLGESLSIYTDFTNANLRKANFSFADLRSADLSEAILPDTTLIAANFSMADLSKALLINAHLNGATLNEANLSGANLFRSYLNEANLSRANLSEAILGWTTIGNVDLRHVQGLDTIKHIGPSSIGIDTILRSEGEIPETFLRGTGATDTFIDYIRSLVGKPIEYYSCFISYSSKDEAFAKRLYADLQSKGVRCWFAPEDIKIGDRIRDRIDESIRRYDKLLLILSQYSMTSEWVEDEVEAALEKERLAKERGEERMVLFPVRLDEAVKTTTKAWAAKLRRQRHIGDFSFWLNHDDYQKAFNRLLRDLKADTLRRLV